MPRSRHNTESVYFLLPLSIGVAPITQLGTCIMKIVHIKRGNSVFPYHKGLLLKERISSRREQILSFMRSPHFEKGRNP